jgi:DNA damage-binding protein 1
MLADSSIREHNLLSIEFLDQPLPAGPLLTFLYLTPGQKLQLQTRLLSVSTQSFTDMSQAIDVVSPRGESVDADSDFSEIPFSCPAARRVLSIPGKTRMALVMGDEYSVLYTITLAAQPARRRSSVASGPGTSPRASAKRSPQTEMVGGGQGKRRKSSTSKAGEKWEMTSVWRIRQGFGTILA